MNFIKSVEHNFLHANRSYIIKKYPKSRKYFVNSDFIASFTVISFGLGVARGKMKRVNQYYETRFSNPLSHMLWFFRK